MEKPEIKVEPKEPQGGMGWYNTPVEVTIEGEGEIRYRRVKGIVVNEGGANEEGSLYEKENPIKIEETGQETIYAWRVDGKYRSDSERKAIKIDVTNPEVTLEPEIENKWYTTDVRTKLIGTDKGSGWSKNQIKIEGVHQDFIDAEEIQIKQADPEREGETKIWYRAVDVAGRTTEPAKEVTIKKDSKPPEFVNQSNGEKIGITNITAQSFNITVLATDEGSGHVKYGKVISYEGEITSPGQPTIKLNKNNEGTWNVTGLKAITPYTIKIWATDPAGQKSDQTIIKSTAGELKAPTVTITKAGGGELGNNEWTNKTLTIRVQDSAAANMTAAASLSYSLLKNGTKITEKTGLLKTGENIPFTTGTAGSNDGTYTLNVWAVDVNGNPGTGNKITTRTIKIDTGNPNQPSITITPKTLTDSTGTYCTENTVATITGGTDITSGIYAIKYKITGRNQIAETTITKDRLTGGTSTQININVEGISTITAWTIDQAGNQSVNRSNNNSAPRQNKTRRTINSSSKWNIAKNTRKRLV